MISEITDSFRQDYGKLPEEVRQRVRKAYRQWMDNPLHPSLHYKRIHATLPIWSVGVGLRYRVVESSMTKKCYGILSGRILNTTV